MRSGIVFSPRARSSRMSLDARGTVAGHRRPRTNIRAAPSSPLILNPTQLEVAHDVIQ